MYNNIPGKYWQPSMAMAPSDFCTFKLLPDTDDAYNNLQHSASRQEALPGPFCAILGHRTQDEHVNS